MLFFEDSQAFETERGGGSSPTRPTLVPASPLPPVTPGRTDCLRTPKMGARSEKGEGGREHTRAKPPPEGFGREKLFRSRSQRAKMSRHVGGGERKI